MQDLTSPIQTTSPCFLADRMVGKLARWLRLLGYDTAYLPQLSPNGVMREARRQGRIILTRDSRIIRQKDAPSFIFIEQDRFRDQLQQVVTALRLDPTQRLFTRCSACNAPLQLVTKEKVRQQVPDYVWQTQQEFRCCSECRRVYWSATHKDHVLTELRRLGLLEDRSG
jgi:hypothetical protein